MIKLLELFFHSKTEQSYCNYVKQE